MSRLAHPLHVKITAFGFPKAAIIKLLKLDQELSDDGRYKASRKIHMRRGKHRVPVSVVRCESGTGFYASAWYNNKSHSAWGAAPSHAVARVTDQLRWTIDHLTVDENFEKGVSKRLQGNLKHVDDALEMLAHGEQVPYDIADGTDLQDWTGGVK